MGDEHLNTVLATRSDEFIKSSVENLVPKPSESEGENGCDLPACFTTFSNVLFDAEYEFNSVNDQSLSDEKFPKKIFLNPLFEEEIILIKIDQHHHNAESDLIESMLNRDSSIISSSSKIDSLLDEFTGKLTFLKSIPSGIDKTDCHPENEICLIERLLYDNSSPHPSEEFVSDNSNVDIESLSPSPILVEDSDSCMKEIDLTFNPDDPMPSSIEDDDNDSERDILIREELLDNYSLSLPVIESYYFDIPSFSRPPAKTTRCISENVKTLAKGFYPPSLHFLSFSWESCELISIFNSGIYENLSTTCVNLPIEDDHSPLLAYVIWIFFAYLTLLHLVGSQPMLKSSYKAEDGVIITIPPFVRGVSDVVVEIKGTGKRKSRKGQNQIETEQKREAWRSREKSKAVTVEKERKTEENAKRRAKSAKSYKLYKRKKKERAKFAITSKYKERDYFCQVLVFVSRIVFVFVFTAEQKEKEKNGSEKNTARIRTQCPSAYKHSMLTTGLPFLFC
nr:hypothetical protein [Tanacetum cinerariifolium]